MKRERRGEAMKARDAGILIAAVMVLGMGDRVKEQAKEEPAPKGTGLQEEKASGGKRVIAWEEIEELLRKMGHPRIMRGEGTYWKWPEEKEKWKGGLKRIDDMSKEGDIIFAIVKRLEERLKEPPATGRKVYGYEGADAPDTWLNPERFEEERAWLEKRRKEERERGEYTVYSRQRLRTVTKEEELREAEIYTLVELLRHYPDERAISVLEGAAKRESCRAFSVREAGCRYAYQGMAAQIVEDLKVKKAKEAWEKELEGVKDKAERRKILADVYWSPVEVEHYKWCGAAWVLNTENTPDERMQELAKRMDAVLKSEDTWKEDIAYHMAEELRRLINYGANKGKGVGLLKKLESESNNKSVQGRAKRMLMDVE
jgi:hypothetical protein